MTRMFAMWIAIASLFAAGSLAAFKTRAEIQKRPADAWGAGLRETLLIHMASDNPGHKVLDPRELEKGRMVHLPTPPATGTSDLQAVWHSEPADMTWTTTAAPAENGEQFAERAGRDFTSMLRAFPRR